MPAIDRALILSFEVLVEQGFDPEMVALELYGSYEAAEIFAEMARTGFFRQGKLHSQTSQYGTFSRGPVVLPDSFKRVMRRRLDGHPQRPLRPRVAARAGGGLPELQPLLGGGAGPPDERRRGAGPGAVRRGELGAERLQEERREAIRVGRVNSAG